MSRDVVRRAGHAAVAAVLVLVAGAGCVWGGGPALVEPLVVGVDLQLGGVGGADRVLERGLRLRVGQVNERGLFGSRRVELRVLDNAGDPRRSADNVASLVADPAVSAVVVGGCEACTVAAVETAEAAGVVVVSVAAADLPEPAEPSAKRWAFRVRPSAADGADVLALAVAESGAASVGVLASDDAYGRAGVGELEAALGVHGIDLVVTGWMPPDGDEQAVGEAAAQVAGWQPDPDPFAVPPAGGDVAGPEAVVVWTALPRLADRAAVMLEGAGWRGRLWLDTAAAGELVATGEQAVALAGARMLHPEVLVASDLVADTPERAARQAWMAAYLAEFGTYDAQASFAADAVDVLAAASSSAGSTGREALREALEVLDHPRGLSGHIAVSAGGLRPSALVLVEFVGDAWRPADLG